MVEAMRTSLAKIREATEKIAHEQGFDGAFDSSGNSNTGVPIVLYVKNAPDITKDVVARLQDTGEPSGAPAGAAPAPDATPAGAGSTPAPEAGAVPQP